jgi:hypothetical protein
MVQTEILTEEQIVKQFWKLVDVRDELQEINDSSEEFIESNNQVHNYYVKHLSVLKGKV